MHAHMQTKRHWALWGLVAGALMGLGDFLTFRALGLDMRLAGRPVVVEVSVVFMATYAGLGFALGKLIEARARARADARTIAEQLRALEASQRAALQNEKLAAIGRLAAGIAHEVRNPLGVIRASASMVQEHFTPQEDAYQACAFIRAEIDRLNGLITSLLTFARPAELRLQPVVVERVIDRALQLASEELRRRDITVARESPETVPEVTADPDLLTQVVLSLVVNAAEAIGDHGLIVVRATDIQNELRIEVIDTGPGIPPVDSERVFEPFFTTKPTGTGLGLAMAARIVRAHGGTIDVVPGKGIGDNGVGACFQFRLPIAGPTAFQEGLA
jgi:two-component system sensor histidine kinase HydH